MPEEIKNNESKVKCRHLAIIKIQQILQRAAIGG